MRIRLVPHNPFSASARDLSRELGCLRIRVTHVTQFRPRPSDILINWGCVERWPSEQFGRMPRARVINHPESVAIAQHKLQTMQWFDENNVPTVNWTTDREVANEWIRDGNLVLARTLMRGSAGRGITICGAEDGAEALPNAPLYTRYAKKRDEYRVHVIGGAVSRIQHKRRRRELDREDVDYRVRNHSNGWVFCQEEVEAPTSVTDAAVRAVQALGLDFGAADVGYNALYDTPYVYEVNTAPALEGTTLEVYREGMQELIRQRAAA